MKREEIVRQHDLKDCGVCALLSIIIHYGGYVSKEKLRIDTHTSLEGTNAYHLIEAAKNYGFDSYGMKFDNLDELSSLTYPVIAHVTINHLNHFVVIYKVNKSKLIIMDPAKGKIVMKKSEFEKIWTKHILLFYPKYSLPKFNPEHYLKSFIFQIFKTEYKKIINIIFWTFIFIFVTIFTSYYFKIGINILNVNAKFNILFSFFVLFFFLFLMKTIIYYLKNYFKIILNKNIDGYIHYNFINRLFLLPNYFVKDRTTGEIIVRLNELNSFKMIFSEILTMICIDSILSIGVGIILYNINNTLFLVLLFFVLIYLLFGIISGKVLYSKAIDANENEIKYHSLVIENLDTLITLKNLNVLNKIVEKLNVSLFKYLGCFFRLNKSILNINSISYFLEEILNFLIISIGLVEIINGRLSIINFITFESLLSYFILPFKNIIQIIPDYNYMKVNMDKINDFFSLDLENTQTGMKDFKSGDIVIKDFNFGYIKSNPILKKINLTIKENSFVLFKGKSGSGKSTLCQIISRLIDVENSNIRIGDKNIKDYSLDAIRKNITYVGQKEFLIQDTIRNNILLNRDIDEENFNKIIEICKLEEVVSKKMFRYETYLLKDCMNLSGGEKQRIILARALLNNFNILILDESLSEVNEELELEILNNIRTKFKNKTIIYVSHKKYESYFDKVIDFGALS